VFFFFSVLFNRFATFCTHVWNSLTFQHYVWDIWTFLLH
jgi:hypothetical protein